MFKLWRKWLSIWKCHQSCSCAVYSCSPSCFPLFHLCGRISPAKRLLCFAKLPPDPLWRQWWILLARLPVLQSRTLVQLDHPGATWETCTALPRGPDPRACVPPEDGSDPPGWGSGLWWRETHLGALLEKEHVYVRLEHSARGTAYPPKPEPTTPRVLWCIPGLWNSKNSR